MAQLSGELSDLCEEIASSPDIRFAVITDGNKNSFSIENPLAVRSARQAVVRGLDISLPDGLNLERLLASRRRRRA